MSKWGRKLEKLLIIAGPCAIESEGQINETARFVKSVGANVLRGGAFKPRQRSSSFQGMGKEGFLILSNAGKSCDLEVVSEIVDPRQLDNAYKYLDYIQVGSRNMYNYELLKELGSINKKIILKRAFCATIDEWVSAAEYITSRGNKDVILCERGIRTFETKTRHTLDLAAVPLIHKISQFPIIVDPSHATGISSLVPHMSLASLASGADGLMIEVHPNPTMALCDGEQSLNFSEFSDLMKEINVFF